MPRPFRFGVADVETASGSAWTEFARRAEALGYATLLVPDHYVNQLTPVPALTAARNAGFQRLRSCQCSLASERPVSSAITSVAE